MDLQDESYASQHGAQKGKTIGECAIMRKEYVVKSEYAYSIEY